MSTLDPSSLDLDLNIASFRGLGRGAGFEVASKESVLGDEEHSPAVAHRCLALVKMFLLKGVLDRKEIDQYLDLDESLEEKKVEKSVLPEKLDVGEIVRSIPSSFFNKSMKYTNPRTSGFYLRELNNKDDELKLLKEEIIKKDKIILRKKNVEEATNYILSSSNSIIKRENNNWFILLYEITLKMRCFLFECYLNYDYETTKLMFKKLRALKIKDVDFLNDLNLLNEIRSRAKAPEQTLSDYIKEIDLAKFPFCFLSN